MKRVFVYEYLSGGGLVNGDETASAELLPMGLAMRDALIGDLVRLGDCAVTAATCPRVPAPPLPVASVTPRVDESPFDFVARQAADHDLSWVVAPESGGLLAGLSRLVEPSRWLGCSEAAIRLTTSKRATMQWLAKDGVPTPLAFVDAADVGRWVVKPDDGAGAVDTRVYTRVEDARADWRRRMDAGEATSLEPWVEGLPLSLSLLCSDGGCELLSINRQRILIDSSGLLSFAGVQVNDIGADDPRTRSLRALASQVARSVPSLRGFVGIDLVWHARRGPVVIEVNPRVTCAYIGLSAALGRNVAADLIKIHARARHAHAYA